MSERKAKPESREDYRARLRTQVMRIARDILHREGLSALQVRRVAEEAGCSVGTLYNIFGDVEGLVLAANAETLVELGEALSTVARRSAAGTLEQRLMALAIAYLDYATINRLRWKAVFEHYVADASLVEANSEHRRRLLALIEGQLTAAIDDPSTRADVARALFAAVHGIVLLALDNKLGSFDASQCEREIRFIVSLAAAKLDPR